MAFNENFVVRNGLEVASGLIYADYLTNKVGIGTTTLTDTLTVSGNISGQNVYISGISTVSQKLNVGLAGTVLTASATSGFVGIGTTNPQYALDVRVGSGQTAFYTNGDLIVDGNFETSSVTISNASLSNLNASGIVTANSGIFTTLNVSGTSILGVTSTTNLNVSGITTAGFITATNLNVSGVTTVGFITATGSYVSGTSTITTAVITNLSVTNANVGGIITSTVSDLTVTGLTSTNNLKVSGVSTFVGVGTFSNDLYIGGKVQVASGSTSIFNGDVKFNTYLVTIGNSSSDEVILNSVITSDLIPRLDNQYDIGSSSKNWKSVNAGLGTFDNIYTSGISTLGTVKISSGIVTATTGIITYYGDGGNLTGLPQQGIGIQSAGTVIGSGITSLNFIGAGNTFSINGNSVDISISGIGTQWVTTSSGIVTTSNVGIGTVTPVAKLDVRGDINVTGIITTTGSGGVGIGSYLRLKAGFQATEGGEAAWEYKNGTTGYYLDVDNNDQFRFANYDTTGVWKFLTNSTERVRITNGGNVGIGTTNPTSKLTVSGNVNVTGVVTASSFVGDGSALTGAGSTVADDTTTNSTFYPLFTSTTTGTVTAAKVSSTKLTFNPSTGTLSATVFTSLSDETKKTDIMQIENALDIIQEIRGVKYKLIDDNQLSVGMIAQEVEKVLPEVVSTDENGLKSVSYGNIVGVLIEAIKEQQQQINELKKEINSIKSV